MSNDRTLVLPNPPWGVRPPWDVNHPIDPPRVNEAVEARKTSAAALVETEVARLGEKRISSIVALAQAHAQNIRAAREAQAERQAAETPLPADADLASVAARAHLMSDLDRYLAVLDARVALSGRTFTEATAEVRSDLYVAAESAGGVLRQIRAAERQTRDTIADLEKQAGELALLRMGVESGLKAWKPQDVPPVAPSSPRKKRFGRAE
jgi:hypothetical protein